MGLRACSSGRSSFSSSARGAEPARQLRVANSDCPDQGNAGSLAPNADTEGISALGWLRALPDEAWVGGLGPRAGHLHVAHVLAGGHSGRPHTFIVGLDDGRFPGAGLQDPILLDEERKKLSENLMTSSRALAKRIDLFARLLARLRGTVTLSYSCYDLADDREMFPSPSCFPLFVSSQASEKETRPRCTTGSLRPTRSLRRRLRKR